MNHLVTFLPKWKGEKLQDTYGGKPVLDSEGIPVFAEIYVLKKYKMEGYQGLWIDSFSKRLVNDMTLEDRRDIIENSILEKVKDINDGQLFSGTWDLLLWKNGELKFVELKRLGKDNLNVNQKEFYRKALSNNYKSDQFEIYEWSFDPEILAKKTFPVDHKLFYDEYALWREAESKNLLVNDGVYILRANRPVHRLIGADNLGILYIGKGRNVFNYKRIGNIINSLNETDDSHAGGVRLNSKLRRIYPVKNMEIEVKITERYAELESHLLHSYFVRYGELPPLNRALT